MRPSVVAGQKSDPMLVTSMALHHSACPWEVNPPSTSLAGSTGARPVRQMMARSGSPVACRGMSNWIRCMYGSICLLLMNRFMAEA